MGYHDGEAEAVKSFYEDCFGWDIIDTKDTDESKPVMYAVTGPSDEKWEPTVVSFGNGFIKKDECND